MSRFGSDIFDEDHVGCLAAIEDLHGIITQITEQRNEIFRKYTELFDLAKRLKRVSRGCYCDYDYRCSTCEVKLDIDEFVERELKTKVDKNVT